MASEVPRLTFIEHGRRAFVSVDDLHAWLQHAVTTLDAGESDRGVQALKLVQRNILEAMFQARGEALGTRQRMRYR